MQGRLSAGEHEVADPLAEEDVERFQGALAVDELPIFLGQAVAREIAEPAVRVARIAQRELTETGTARGQNELQRVDEVGNDSCRLGQWQIRGATGTPAGPEGRLVGRRDLSVCIHIKSYPRRCASYSC